MQGKFNLINANLAQTESFTIEKLFDNIELLKIWRSNFKGIRWEDENGNILFGAVDNILVNGKKLIVLFYR